MKTLCPASTSRRAMWAPMLPSPMKPISMVVSSPMRHARACPAHPDFQAPNQPDRDGRDKPGHDETLGYKLFPYLRGMFAQCGNWAIAPRRRRAPLGRRRIGHRAARRADGYAPQMWMM